jgi:ammonium transporter Rh
MSEQNNEPLLTASASPKSGLKVETSGGQTSPQLLVVTTGGGASPKPVSPGAEGNAAATLSNEYRFVHQRIPSRKGKLRYVLPGLLFLLQIVFIILFGVFASYGSADLSNSNNAIFFNILMVVGFGFIASFLKRFGYGSVGFNLLLVAFVIQWALLLRGWLDGKDGYFKVSLNSLIFADFTTVAVLISFGVVLGKTTLTQLAVLALVEAVIQVLNEHLNVHIIQAYDVGRSIYVHLFGALFGLAVSKFLNCSGVKSNKQASVYHSDVFALIGTVSVFALYPVFNAALSSSFDGQTRAIINTVAAIAASVVVTVGLSSLLGKGKISILHVQHAAIVGGIAIGSVADMKIQIYIALLAGAVGGFLATLSYQYVTVRLFFF